MEANIEREEHASGGRFWRDSWKQALKPSIRNRFVLAISLKVMQNLTGYVATVVQRDESSTNNRFNLQNSGDQLLQPDYLPEHRLDGNVDLASGYGRVRHCEDGDDGHHDDLGSRQPWTA